MFDVVVYNEGKLLFICFMHKDLYLILFLLLSPVLLHAQLNNTVFYQHKKLSGENAQQLYLELNMLGFAKNNEYSDEILEGYTLFGYQFNPELVYYPSEHIRLDAGIYWQKDFGNNRFTEVAPTFSFTYKKDSLTLIFGNLEGSLSHRLPEPLYDFEKVLYDRLENGVQLKISKSRLFLDAWVNWENAIYRGDAGQEEVTGGFSLDYTFLEKNGLKFNVPAHLVVNHLGGEFDVNPAPVTTLLNTSLGLGAEKQLNPGGLAKNIRLDYYYMFYKDNSSTQRQAFVDGSGHFLNLTLDTRWLSIMGSYWAGHEFISSKGGLIYQTQSSRYNEAPFSVSNRNLFIVRFMRAIKLMENCFLSLRLEPFINLESGEFKSSQGIYINFRPDWFLLNTRNN